MSFLIDEAAEAKLRSVEAFAFDVDNTIVDVLTPGYDAIDVFLPKVAEKVGVDTHTLGLELDKALLLKMDVFMGEVVHLCPSVVKAAIAQGHLSEEQGQKAVAALKEIYAANGNAVKPLIDEYNLEFRMPILEGKVASTGRLMKKGFLTDEYRRFTDKRLESYVYPGILTLMDELRSRNFPVFQQTSQPAQRYLTEKELKMPISRHADAVITAHDDKNEDAKELWTYEYKALQAGLSAPHFVFPNAGEVKKSAHAFNASAALFGLLPNKLAMVGDNRPEDVAIPQSFGAMGILAGWGDLVEKMKPSVEYHWYSRGAVKKGEAVTPDWVPSTPAEFLEVVQALDLQGDPEKYKAFKERIAYLQEREQPVVPDYAKKLQVA